MSDTASDTGIAANADLVGADGQEKVVGLYDGVIQFEPMFENLTDTLSLTQMFLWETGAEEPTQVAVWYWKEDDLERLITDARIALNRIREVRRRTRELASKGTDPLRPRKRSSTT